MWRRGDKDETRGGAIPLTYAGDARTDESRGIMTDLFCFTCQSEHPASEGITVFTRQFECECGESWEDTWCSDCNDRCPGCNAECEPEEVIEETVIVAAT